MGHKTGDGLSIVVNNDSGGALSHGDPAAISGVFGFCDTDVDSLDDVSLSIGQEEREVLLVAKVGGWAVGDNVYFDGTVFDDVAGSASWDTPVGTVARAVDAAGGYGWMIVIPGAFAGRA
jgi:hypothetical protein